MEATLEDIINDIPCSKELEQELLCPIANPADEDLTRNLDLGIFESLLPAPSPLVVEEQDQCMFLGPSTNTGKGDSFDHNYSINVRPSCSKEVLSKVSKIASPSMPESENPRC